MRSLVLRLASGISTLIIKEQLYYLTVREHCFSHPLINLIIKPQLLQLYTADNLKQVEMDKLFNSHS